jgi:hypothetical protein
MARNPSLPRPSRKQRLELIGVLLFIGSLEFWIAAARFVYHKPWLVVAESLIAVLVAIGLWEALRRVLERTKPS